MTGIETAEDAALTVEEAARFLGIKPKTLYRWAAEGKVPSIKAGGARRFSPSALAGWREAHSQGTEE